MVRLVFRKCDSDLTDLPLRLSRLSRSLTLSLALNIMAHVDFSPGNIMVQGDGSEHDVAIHIGMDYCRSANHWLRAKCSSAGEDLYSTMANASKSRLLSVTSLAIQCILEWLEGLSQKKV
jgi:hypothetical protein